MCGRFTLAYEDWGTMLEYWAVSNLVFEQSPRYNVAPGQDIAAIVAGRDERRVGMLKWGLVPNWAKSEKAMHPPINARAETLLDKPTFKQLVSRKRCLIPADGFYEWKAVAGSKAKQPYRIVTTDRPFFGFAGLYDTWVNDAGDRVSTCAIITTKPNALMKDIHNRMPAILARGSEDIWLDHAVTDGELAHSLLQPYPAEQMRAYPVSQSVGNFRNDTSDCLAEVD